MGAFLHARHIDINQSQFGTIPYQFTFRTLASIDSANMANDQIDKLDVMGF